MFNYPKLHSTRSGHITVCLCLAVHSTVYPYALTKKSEKNRYLGAYPTHMIQGPFKTQITVRQHGKQFGGDLHKQCSGNFYFSVSICRN